MVIESCMPCALAIFIDDFMKSINDLQTEHMILIAGDFNLGQMLPENVAKFDPLIKYFNLSQLSQYSTHTCRIIGPFN